MVYRTNSMNLEASLAMELATEKLLLKIPEVERVFCRLGTSEVATDPMPPSQNDLYIFYKPHDQWRKVDGQPIAKSALAALIEEELSRDLPDQSFLFAQPIEMRFNEMLEGSKSALSVKVFGPEFDMLEKLAGEIRDTIKTVKGGDAELEVDGRTSTLVLDVKRSELLRRNIASAEVNRAVSAALGGETVGTMIEGSRRRDIVVRLPDTQRSNFDTIRALPVRVGDLGILPLGQLVDLKTVKTVEPIGHELGHRRVGLMVGVEGRDMEGFVNEAIARIKERVPMPAGYSFEFGGTFKNLSEARSRLAVVVPSALVLILVLIFAAFRSLRQTFIIATGIPLALTGGIFALLVRGMPFSITAAVGFIALSGVAVLNGLVMITYFNQLREEGRTVREAVREGAMSRLRPVLMTALVAALGFIPMAIATGAGAEVQRPLATVVIGGILSSTFLTLILLPVLYAWLEREPGNESPLPVASPGGREPKKDDAEVLAFARESKST
jgi:cobalt-zinc-cadmium resistance protein CzcA